MKIGVMYGSPRPPPRARPQVLRSVRMDIRAPARSRRARKSSATRPLKVVKNKWRRRPRGALRNPLQRGYLQAGRTDRPRPEHGLVEEVRRLYAYRATRSARAGQRPHDLKEHRKSPDANREGSARQADAAAQQPCRRRSRRKIAGTERPRGSPGRCAPGLARAARHGARELAYKLEQRGVAASVLPRWWANWLAPAGRATRVTAVAGPHPYRQGFGPLRIEAELEAPASPPP